MSSVNFGPVNDAESLIAGVFAQLEQQADPQIAELHYENQLRRFVAQEAGGVKRGSRQRHPGHLRPAFRLLTALVALLLLGSWAGNLPIPRWQDGQQIRLSIPEGFSESDYMHWVAVFANRSRQLADYGGHSLIVDYVPAEQGYVLQLSVLGVDYSTANEWLRGTIAGTPALRCGSYAITQPQVSYSVTVKDMLAYALGRTDAVERRVLEAWQLGGSAPSGHGMIYLIAGPQEDLHRASMLR